MTTTLTTLPENLPVPEDDGAARHLPGMAVPPLTLTTTSGQRVHLDGSQGRIVVYVYPMTGRPGHALPDGWDHIPGARGCTPESCAFRDHHGDFARLSTTVYGVSTQSPEEQQEARERLHLPFELLSDTALTLKTALQLPTFTVPGRELYKRLTLVIDGGRIVKVFYPVFPPDTHAGAVLTWLRAHPDPLREPRLD